MQCIVPFQFTDFIVVAVVDLIIGMNATLIKSFHILSWLTLMLTLWLFFIKVYFARKKTRRCAKLVFVLPLWSSWNTGAHGNGGRRGCLLDWNLCGRQSTSKSWFVKLKCIGLRGSSSNSCCIRSECVKIYSENASHFPQISYMRCDDIMEIFSKLGWGWWWWLHDDSAARFNIAYCCFCPI